MRISIERLFFLLPAMVACLCDSMPGAWAAPQKSSVISLIPAANWQLLSSQKLDVSAVSRFGADAAVDREYGVKSIAQRQYTLVDKQADVIIEEGPDPSAAYGLFTYYRTPAMSAEKGIPLAVSGQGVVLMARNRAFVRVLPHGGLPLQGNDIRALLLMLGGGQTATDAMAQLPAPLPAAGMVPGSEKYLLGPEAFRHVLPSFNADLIGFSQGAEAQLADYGIGTTGHEDRPARSGTILAITYPTPQIAQQRFGAIEKSLALNQDRGAQSVYGKHKGSFVILTVNTDPGLATKLLAQFNISEQISWDQKYPGNKSVVWQMVELVVANFLLAFILAGLAIIVGALIAVSRRLAGKWFPESDWGNPDGETLTTLKLR